MTTNAGEFNKLMDRWIDHGQDVKNLRAEFNALMLKVIQDAQAQQDVIDTLTREVEALSGPARCAAAIAVLLDGVEWEANDDLERIAEMLRSQGFQVRDPDDDSVAAEEAAHTQQFDRQAMAVD